MKNLGLVFTFEAKTYLRKKSFLVTTLVLIAVILLVTSIPTLISFFTGGKGIDGDAMFGSKELGYYTANSAVAEQIQSSQTLPEMSLFSSEEQLKDAVTEGTINKGYIFETEKSFKSITMDQGMHDQTDQLIIQELQRIARDEALRGAGIDPMVVDNASNIDIQYSSEVLGKRAQSSFSMVFIAMILVYTLVLMYGSIIATSVAREKSDRTMELLVTSTSPFSLIVGKVLAAAVIGVLQMSLFGLSMAIGLMLNKDSYPEGLLDSVGLRITPDGLAIFLIFSILGYLMYLFMFAGLGALVSKVEDVSTSISPVMMVFIAVYMLTNFTINLPESIIARVSSIVPLSSPMAMFARYSLVSIPAFELILAVVLLVISTLLLAWISIKIYRLGTLNYGNRVGLIKALRTVFSKKQKA
ncbi:MAG: ABC transporter permease [Tissierellia bacterium]|nr:ABC transporter permease [Tissierellia bacterium]